MLISQKKKRVSLCFLLIIIMLCAAFQLIFVQSSWFSILFEYGIDSDNKSRDIIFFLH